MKPIIFFVVLRSTQNERFNDNSDISCEASISIPPEEPKVSLQDAIDGIEKVAAYVKQTRNSPDELQPLFLHTVKLLVSISKNQDHVQ